MEKYNTSEYKGTRDISNSESNGDTLTGMKGILSNIVSWVLILVILVLAILFLVGAFS